MIITVNGQNHIVLSQIDFIELVKDYMGDEAHEYLDNLINDYELKIETLEDDIDNLENELAYYL